MIGGAGYRSRYLSHAKRALYHLSYAPCLSNERLNRYLEISGVDKELQLIAGHESKQMFRQSISSLFDATSNFMTFFLHLPVDIVN